MSYRSDSLGLGTVDEKKFFRGSGRCGGFSISPPSALCTLPSYKEARLPFESFWVVLLISQHWQGWNRCLTRPLQAWSRVIFATTYAKLYIMPASKTCFVQSITELLFHTENDQKSIWIRWIFAHVSPSNWTCPGWDLLPPLQQGKHRCDKEKQDWNHQDRWCQRWRSLASMVGGEHHDLNPKKMSYVQICKLIKTAPHNFVHLTYMPWSKKPFTSEWSSELCVCKWDHIAILGWWCWWS